MKRILLSAHRDTIIPLFPIEYQKGVHAGLLDNWIGMLVTYLALYRNASLQKLAATGGIKLYHGNHEEFGMLDRSADGIDLVIVVDVCAGSQYKGKDFALENAYRFPLKSVVEDLEWEGYKILAKHYTGAKEDEDEAFEWVARKVPVVSFIIPIEAKDDSWHRPDATISHEKVERCVNGLTRLICYSL